MRKYGKIDGQNTLYHYFQKNMLSEENDFSKELVERLLIDLAIWIPPSFYRQLPIILPYVVRDPSCRPRGKNTRDEWGSANRHGFLRDDNTLVKAIVRSFKVRSSKIELYDGRKLGKGFVASHIWGVVNYQGNPLISSRHHMLNSFVPNLVWLPVQISKLTDRAESYAQRLLQAISCRIYHEIDMPEEISRLWACLPFPKEFRDLEVDVAELNYFEVPGQWLRKRIDGLLMELNHIALIDNYDNELPEIKCQRYPRTLAQVSPEDRKDFNEWLIKYREMLLSL